jgi:dTDP-4-dehydrorhamnose 3,5-epimerase
LENFKLNVSPFEGLFVLEKLPKKDNRGFFERLFCESELKNFISKKNLKQINHSFTQKSGSIRGMHFQVSPFQELKVVHCIKGRVFDVVVDLRPSSETFKQWFGIELSDSNNRLIIIPNGVAHGFQTLEDDCDLIYLHDENFKHECQNGLNAFDANVGIEWPIAVTEMSERDRGLPMIDSQLLMSINS